MNARKIIQMAPSVTLFILINVIRIHCAQIHHTNTHAHTTQSASQSFRKMRCVARIVVTLILISQFFIAFFNSIMSLLCLVPTSHRMYGTIWCCCGSSDTPNADIALSSKNISKLNSTYQSRQQRPISNWAKITIKRKRKEKKIKSIVNMDVSYNCFCASTKSKTQNQSKRNNKPKRYSLQQSKINFAIYLNPTLIESAENLY